jgi:hypothetical protein
VATATPTRPSTVTPSPSTGPTAHTTATPAPVSSPPPAPAPNDERTFPQTGYRIADDAFWTYFQRRGGVQTFGYPVSDSFNLLGSRVQLFQRLVMQLRPDGGIGTLNLLDAGLLPYTAINGSTFPASDPDLIGQTPSPNDPTYLASVIQFVQQNAPDTFDGHQVNFGQTFFSTVPASMAFPDGVPDNGTTLLAGFDLEMWGLPTSRPTYDPANKNFIYLRFQRGIMHYDAGCDCTHGLLLADYLKALLLNQSVPDDLASEARASPLLAEWAPSLPNAVARPAELGASDLTNAFVTIDGKAPPPAPQPTPMPRPALSTAATLAASVTPTAPPTMPVPTPTPVPLPPHGYDVSFPQCSKVLPETPLFAIIGVNGGRVFELNPCLTLQANWGMRSSASSGPKLSLYVNTGNPGPGDPHWPADGTHTPRACDGSGSVDCAYDFGWSAAAYAYSGAAEALGGNAATVPWWLDVETANSWSEDTEANAASIQGEVDQLRSMKISNIGIYSNPRHWGVITGADSPTSQVNRPFASLFNWTWAGAGISDVRTVCGGSFTGGRVVYVQFPAEGLDGDFLCP